MRLLRSKSELDSLVSAFASKLEPRLNSMRGSFGRCKFASYELALFLRAAGLRARILHCQGLTEGNQWKETAHKAWRKKPRGQWSHYVVVCGTHVIDLTARQFDTALEYPTRMSVQGLSKLWAVVEEDSFMNRWTAVVLKHGVRGGRQKMEQPGTNTRLV